MTLERFDIFNQIHKGLRALLYHVALEIQQTNFSDRESAGLLIKEVEQVVHFFEAHAEHEDRYILPLVERYDPQLIESFENEHEEDHRLSAQLLADVQAWQAAQEAQERLQIGRHIFYHFNEFVAFNLYHMNREEQLLNKVLWAHYTDEEILETERRILATVPPAILAVESGWMMKGMNDLEIIGWLKGVQHGAPEPLFQSFLQLAEETLPAERWERVRGAIAEAEAMVS